jgi:hypothetical protein
MTYIVQHRLPGAREFSNPTNSQLARLTKGKIEVSHCFGGILSPRAFTVTSSTVGTPFCFTTMANPPL